MHHIQAVSAAAAVAALAAAMARISSWPCFHSTASAMASAKRRSSKPARVCHRSGARAVRARIVSAQRSREPKARARAHRARDDSFVLDHTVKPVRILSKQAAAAFTTGPPVHKREVLLLPLRVPCARRLTFFLNTRHLRFQL